MSHQNPFLESLSSMTPSFFPPITLIGNSKLKLSFMAMISSNIQMDLFLCRQKRSHHYIASMSQTKTSHDLWTHLKSAYVKASHNHLKQLKECLCVASKGTQFITTYMHSLKQTTDLLASLSSHVYVEDMTDHVLRGLDDGYRAVIDGINERDIPFSFDDLLEKLLIQELSVVAA
ncbi:hypothetical protein Lal_00048543 [Lupinus albus]|nr:hypothetical protein Lal_00048543 [Lupinus albus]